MARKNKAHSSGAESSGAESSGAKSSGAKSSGAKSSGEGRRSNHWVDPSWPSSEDGSAPVTELASSVAGGLSPFGDTEFPLEDVPYVHPTTVVNKAGVPSPGERRPQSKHLG